MLELTSARTTKETDSRSRSQERMRCSTPSSSTRKSLFFRSAATAPFWSKTMTGICTSSTSATIRALTLVCAWIFPRNAAIDTKTNRATPNSDAGRMTLMNPSLGTVFLHSSQGDVNARVRPQVTNFIALAQAVFFGVRGANAAFSLLEHSANQGDFFGHVRLAIAAQNLVKP